MGDTVAIIPARAGSKGIPCKNLIELCGKPLVSWSIEQALRADRIESVWVSSDGDEILDIAKTYGAHPIRRPAKLSDDRASSESAWLHAMDVIEAGGCTIDRVVAMQATSPIREPRDLDEALALFEAEDLDSLLSVVEIKDFFVWQQADDGRIDSVNYDYRNRPLRQHVDKLYRENGSFYIFKPEILRTHNNRLGGRIGMYVMEGHKSFQIDTPEDVRLCAVIMDGYGLDLQ